MSEDKKVPAWADTTDDSCPRNLAGACVSDSEGVILRTYTASKTHRKYVFNVQIEVVAENEESARDKMMSGIFQADPDVEIFGTELIEQRTILERDL